MGNAGICDLRGRCAECSLGMQDTFGGFRRFKGRTTSMYKIENIKIKMCNNAKVQENSQSIEFLLILLVRGNKTIFDWRSAIFSSKNLLWTPLSYLQQYLIHCLFICHCTFTFQLLIIILTKWTSSRNKAKASIILYSAQYSHGVLLVARY